MLFQKSSSGAPQMCLRMSALCKLSSYCMHHANVKRCIPTLSSGSSVFTTFLQRPRSLAQVCQHLFTTFSGLFSNIVLHSTKLHDVTMSWSFAKINYSLPMRTFQYDLENKRHRFYKACLDLQIMPGEGSASLR